MSIATSFARDFAVWVNSKYVKTGVASLGRINGTIVVYGTVKGKMFQLYIPRHLDGRIVSKLEWLMARQKKLGWNVFIANSLVDAQKKLKEGIA